MSNPFFDQPILNSPQPKSLLEEIVAEHRKEAERLGLDPDWAAGIRHVIQGMTEEELRAQRNFLLESLRYAATL